MIEPGRRRLRAAAPIDPAAATPRAPMPEKPSATAPAPSRPPAAATRAARRTAALALAAALALLGTVPSGVSAQAQERPAAPTAEERAAALAAEVAAAREAQAAAEEAAAAATETELAAGATAPGDFEIFVDTVDVRVVNVDVFVTDRQGEPVTGLTRDDFELRENRREVPITNFYAVEEGRQRGGEAAGAIADLPVPPPAAPQAIAASAVPEEQRLHLIVYVDNFNIRPASRNRVLREIGYFLNTQVGHDDRVMLVSYDRSLKVRRPFTSDPQLVSAALEELERVTGHGVSRDDERRRVLEQIDQADSVHAAASYARMHAESVENDLRFTVGALKELIGTLAGLPGRKAILYVSDGLPMVPGQDVYHAVDARFSGESGPTGILTDSFGYDASRDFRDLANTANANRVSFYTIDAAGLRLQSSFTAENARPNVSVMVDSSYNSNHQSPLRFLAETTGGQAILNTNRVLPGLERVARDFDTYYSLGFSPAHAANGRYHSLEVRVKGRRDLVVRHREGYRDKSIEARMTDGTVAALHFSAESNPLSARLRFAGAEAQANRLYRVGVDVEVPIGQLVLVPRGETHEARLRLFVAALDSEGDASPVQQVMVPISIPNAEVEAARGQVYRYSLPLVMRGGTHRVAVGLRDELGGQESFVTGSVTPGAPAAGGAAAGRR
jgi:VWFA-related protein